MRVALLPLLVLLGVLVPVPWPQAARAQLAAKPTRGPHPASPCPSVFSYEGREPDKNRWYGVVLVSSGEPLDGLRLNVRLTHRAQILGNFIGDVSTSDNVEFTILNLKMRVNPGPPLPIRIFAAFGDRDDIPYIENIKLNGRTICSGSHPEQQSSVMDTPQRLSPSRPASNGGSGSGGGGGNRLEYEDPRARPSTTTTTAKPVVENYYPPTSSNVVQVRDPSVTEPPGLYRPGPGPAPAPVRNYTAQPQPQHSASPSTEPVREMQPQSPPERGIYRPLQEQAPASVPVPGRAQATLDLERPEPARPAPMPAVTPARTAPPQAQPVTQFPVHHSSQISVSSSSGGRHQEPEPPPQPWPTSNYDERPVGPSGSGSGNSQPVESQQPPQQPQQPQRRPTRQSRCGTIAPPATPLIINGETSIPGKWPWHVALYKPHGRDWKYQCGGSLVSQTVVVTAAHCVTTSVGRPVGPESLLVFLGKHALRTTTEDGVQDKHVYFIHVHPGYNYTNYRNDIAVLILSSPAAITSAVRPVCLWDRDRTDLSHVEGKFGTVVGWRTDTALPDTDSHEVVGWGIETDGLLTEELHQALMPVVSPAICIYSYPSFFGLYTGNHTYCAGYSPDQLNAGTSVCNGDSGGGMFFKRDEEVPDDEAVWMLRGLVSLSVRTKQDRCDPSHFVVFTDVAKYGDWLDNFLAP